MHQSVEYSITYSQQPDNIDVIAERQTQQKISTIRTLPNVRGSGKSYCTSRTTVSGAVLTRSTISLCVSIAVFTPLTDTMTSPTSRASHLTHTESDNEIS